MGTSLHFRQSDNLILVKETLQSLFLSIVLHNVQVTVELAIEIFLN